MRRLELAAQADDHHMFLAQLDAMDWLARSPDDLLRAIQFAVSMNLVRPARALADVGAHLFPNHAPLRRAVRALAPPVVLGWRAAPPPKGLDGSREWLRNHAHEYRGQWIAVYDGQLLGAARTLEELRAAIRRPDHPNSTIITHVL